MSAVLTEPSEEAIADPTGSAVKRGARTVIQGGAAGVILEAIDAFGLYQFTTRQFAVSLVVLSALVSLVQNKLENDAGRGILR